MSTKLSTYHNHRESGFTLIELVVVTVVVFAFVSALIPLISNRVVASKDSAVRQRGRDIYVAITGANTEREPLGLSPVWPTDNIVTNGAKGSLNSLTFDFDNSTDYFKCLYDEEHLGTDQWSPLVYGFDYSKLAGAGVPMCENGKLTAEFNMWTIAKNLTDQTPDFIPFLITRNMDASSFATSVKTNTLQRKLRFDPRWNTPFGDKMGCIIYTGGGITFWREKFMTYMRVYNKELFDMTGGTNGVASVHPLKYLTPDSEVSLGDKAYAEGAQRVARHKAGIGLVLKNKYWSTKGNGIIFACISALMYVVFAAIFFTKDLSRISRHALGCGVLHWFVTNLYIAFVIVLFDVGWKRFVWWALAFVLVAHLASVMVFGFVKERDTVRKRYMKRLIVVPLLLFGIPAGGVAALILLVFSLGNPVLWIIDILLVIAVIVYLMNVVKRIRE